MFSRLLLDSRRSDVSEYGSSRRLPNSGTGLQPLETILEEPEYLDSVDKFSQIFLETFMPTVQNGNAAEVRAFLKTLADGGSHSAAKEAIEKVRHRKENEVEERRSPSATSVHNRDIEDFKPNNSQKDCVSQYVNLICPRTGLSPLTCAIIVSPVSVVTELLVWGAYPNYEVTTKANKDCDFAVVFSTRASAISLAINACQLCSRCSVSSPDQVCNGCEQLMERTTSVIEVLLSAGCKITPSVWRSLFVMIRLGRNFLALFQTLVRNQFSALPIGCVVKAVRSGFNGVSELCNRPGLEIYWSSDCVTSDTVLGIIANSKSTHFLLKLPVSTRQQKAYKTLFCQIALIKLLSTARSRPRPRGQCPEAFLSVLLEQGANIHGWSEVQAKVMVNIYKDLDHQENYQLARLHARHHSKTRIERHLFYRLMCFLMEPTVTWDMSQIPYVRDYLCEHHVPVTMEEQSVVSACTYMRSIRNLANLQALCRDVVLSCLLCHPDIMDAVDTLPLPLTFRDLLLSNK